MLQSNVFPFTSVLLSPDVINYCTEHCVKSWEKIVIYSLFFVRCFSLLEESSADLTLTCLWSWVKVGNCWSIRMRGDEEGSCLFLWSSGETDKMCWDTQELLQMCKPPLFSPHAESTTINSEWWGFKKKKKRKEEE